MSTFWIVLLGVFMVTGLGLFALVVGVGEASDSDAVGSGEKLPRWERALVRMRRRRSRW